MTQQEIAQEKINELMAVIRKAEEDRIPALRSGAKIALDATIEAYKVIGIEVEV
jgi:hypothetical protein